MANQKTYLRYRFRRQLLYLLFCVIIAVGIYFYQNRGQAASSNTTVTFVSTTTNDKDKLATTGLSKLPVKPALSTDNYERDKFGGSSWNTWKECNTRQKILNRDIKDKKIAANDCTVISGYLDDPYTGKRIELKDKSAVAREVQIDHVVALANAWQTGAQDLTEEQRDQLANDDLELLAVSSDSNQEKSSSDAAQWLPSNRAFRCEYVTRQIAIKLKYSLWVTTNEKAAMSKILSTCPSQALPV